MVRDDLRQFLRAPADFARDVSEESKAAWLTGLEFAQKCLAATGGALRDAQEQGWRGIADHRAALVLGPPGTGKTFALSWMALGFLEGCRAVNRPCRVFLTGFTKNSIANLLEAFQKRAKHAVGAVDLFWLGNVPGQGLPDEIQCIRAAQLKDALAGEYAVVGATGWSLFKAIGAARPPDADGPTAPLFDLVCIDEASQMVVSQGLLSLIGLAPEGRVLVAGDDKQLPPVRETHEREVDGLRLGSSLYGFLENAGVQVFPLTETFRLNELLSEYPAHVFYEGQYSSAEEVRTATLSLKDGWDEGLNFWQRHALDPKNPVCILFHDGPLCGTSNDFEAKLVSELAELLADRMLPEDGASTLTPEFFWTERLAVVSPHRAQNAGIRARLRGGSLGEGCIVETVDRIQGRERDAIIASYTVSDPEFAKVEADFIFSPERFNVTVTRARTKLILIVSRRLVNVVPEDDALFGKAQVLRDYVFATKEVGVCPVAGPQSVPIQVAVRVRRFGGALDLESDPTPALPSEPDEGALTPSLRELLDEIRRLSRTGPHHNAPDYQLSKQLSRRIPEVRREIVELFSSGFVTVRLVDGSYGVFWTATPRKHPVQPLPCNLDNVRAHVERVIREEGGRFPAFYFKVRSRFCWLDQDGRDSLRPHIDVLVDEGLLHWGEHKGIETLAQATAAGEDEAEERPPLPMTPSEEDFRVLNRLEEIEERRINFGVFESWVSPADLARDLGCTLSELAPVLRTLRRDGWLMRLEDGRLRSRAAELAREVRYVKQRFREGDANRRPFLVRSLKVRFQDRDRPTRVTSLRQTLDEVSSHFPTAHPAAQVFDALHATLAERWKVDDPLLAAFQARGFGHLVPSWFGLSDQKSMVITADTGSGKTEAAVLPIIAAASIDALEGTRGTRAVLVYPRVRLANNQAQRLAGYLAALTQQAGMPQLTLGLQSGEVPSSFPPPDWVEELWEPIGPGRYLFPFFGCPEGTCDGQLVLTATDDDREPDHLNCQSCGWFFGGWIGSKRGLGKASTSLWVTTTESLHGWLHSQWRGRLFGDPGTGFDPPRALLADEIHLYSHVHGAQVGYAFRRLLARARVNAPRGGAPLAIGMSATLGEPERIWEALCGYRSTVVIRPEEDEREPNPRSREYFYFVQPEVESRGKDIAGASTTIQSLMCLAHGMRRRTGEHGGYRAVAFLDSIDKVKRLHSDYLDAERNNRLARLRTELFDQETPETERRRECCGTPDSCSRFLDGECWFFAARDPFQETAHGAYRRGQGLEVSPAPVFSGTSGRVDDQIRRSDVLFATSTLEVGFDDPDMALVYQHYAPLNPASFVQRKGRAGRGADDRPITGTTLSAYSPRDTWFFRKPERMFDSEQFQVPLNMANFFIRRGQLLSVLFDAAARESHWRTPSPTLQPTTFRTAERLASYIFEGEILAELGVNSLEELWDRYHHLVSREPSKGLSEWAKAIPDVPSNLFETINLPVVEIAFKDDEGRQAIKDEDIRLALAACAPGSATRRYGFRLTHWSPPRPGHAPWSAVNPEGAHGSFEPVPGGLEALKAQIPSYLHDALGSDARPKVVRPATLDLESMGRFDGATWTPFVGLDLESNELQSLEEQPAAAPVNSKSEGSLNGFIVCDARKERGQAIGVSSLEPLTSGLYAYQGNGTEAEGTGLRASRIYWGAETRLVVETGEYTREERIVTQTFVDPQEHERHLRRGGPKPSVQMYGYSVETEGIRLRLNSDLLDRFVTETGAELAGTGEERWLRGQFFRFLLLSGGPKVGLNRFQARELADLLVTARGFSGTRARLQKLIARWDARRLADLLLETFQEHLVFNPLLTERRVRGLAEGLSRSSAPALKDYLANSIRLCGDRAGFHGYLRSLALHSLAVRLQQLFVLYGAGDPRRVLFHAKLPIQFGASADDVIVICEDGEHGDGTTRTFLERVDRAFEGLRADGLDECSNAREDAAIARALSDLAFLHRWGDIDPTSEAGLRGMAADLGVDVESDAGIVQAVVRLLTEAEEIGGERFTYRGLHQEVRGIRVALRSDLNREPSSWELVGRIVALAKRNDPQVPTWAQLRASYASLEDASQEGSLEADERLGDQIHRLGAHLCVDGCQACLHTGTPLFPSQFMDSTVSRLVLQRLEHFLGWR